MKTAVITYIDNNHIKNLENDFLNTLRNTANYKGEIYVIYYGRNREKIWKLNKKYKINTFYADKKFRTSNQRNIDITLLLKRMPKEITHIICLDGGDVWFQDSIDEIFEKTKCGYGFVEEDEPADKEFNFQCIAKIQYKNIRDDILKKLKNLKLINSGMIAGEKDKILSIMEDITKLTNQINQDFFALDQTIFNYVIRLNNKGINLPSKYNFCLITRENGFEVIKNKIYDENKELVNIIHNNGNDSRVFPNGMQDIKKLHFISKFPKKLPGSFWGITAFFNPVGYKNKYENYKIFRESSKKQGLNLIAVELAFKNKQFELKKEDAEILIQLRAEDNNILWQKERLINIGIEKLPKDCDKFAWLDADIIFCNNEWVKETCKLLENYAIIQPFEYSIRLPKGIYNLNPEKIILGSEIELENFKSRGIASMVNKVGKEILEKSVNFHGIPGFVWAGRKEIFDKYGLFDKAQCSDCLMAHIFYKNRINKSMRKSINTNIEKSLYEWKKNIFPKIKGSIFFSKGIILHLWHGKIKDRYYVTCDKILKDYDFEPEKDMKIDDNKCWAWASNKQILHKEIKNYFFIKNEENSIAHILIFPVIFKLRILKNLDSLLGLTGLYLKKEHINLYKFLKSKFDFFLKKI